MISNYNGQYPLSDSEFISYSSIQRKPVLRIFETNDLPLHRGDFTSQHAVMVRSRQLSEIAGLMDESLSDQPTLKRFSRYNQSMRSRPSSYVCDVEPGSSQQQQPHTCSKINSRLKTGFFSGNWTLRSKKEQKMRPSVHDITAIKFEKSHATLNLLISTNIKKFRSSNLAAVESPLISTNAIKSNFPIPLEQHFQDQCCHVNNSVTSSYVRSDNLTSLHDHRILPTSLHHRNFTFFIIYRSEKFCADSERESGSAVQTKITSTQFKHSPKTFTRLSTRDSSIAAGQLERIVPIELTTSNGQNQFVLYAHIFSSQLKKKFLKC
ncbi:hypothetical protein X798_01373 [Onchocerca flexuosa]|uniref:Uncharacterized protein n=1 Tax=Onchocerca flexuosa TaxID=387005 RepID=A0A238C308_9BILA|nr:hypothetical protein X798_01373 [Onchocerca flexuosa]